MRLWKILPGSIQSPLPRKPTKGDEIRARIEANRRKRLAIAEAMKAEAGVVEHNVWEHEFAGLAELENGRIHSPEGRNMRQLYIVAHECGHIFLHTADPGIRFPPHVMELEAETYAHHAFREHGMRVPRDVTEFARDYVASWIAKDREAGHRIDQRAVDFALGIRSPFEPLRMVPSAWQQGRVLGDWLWRAGHHVMLGACLYIMAQISAPLTGLPLDGVKPDGVVWPLICAAAAAGLVWACFAISFEIAIWGRRYRSESASHDRLVPWYARSAAIAAKFDAGALDRQSRHRRTGGER